MGENAKNKQILRLSFFMDKTGNILHAIQNGAIIYVIIDNSSANDTQIFVRLNITSIKEADRSEQKRPRAVWRGIGNPIRKGCLHRSQKNQKEE